MPRLEGSPPPRGRARNYVQIAKAFPGQVMRKYDALSPRRKVSSLSILYKPRSDIGIEVYAIDFNPAAWLSARSSTKGFSQDRRICTEKKALIHSSFSGVLSA
jgi:hypothetical protein